MHLQNFVIHYHQFDFLQDKSSVKICVKNSRGQRKSKDSLKLCQIFLFLLLFFNVQLSIDEKYIDPRTFINIGNFDNNKIMQMKSFSKISNNIKHKF